MGYQRYFCYTRRREGRYLYDDVTLIISTYMENAIQGIS